MSLWDRIYPTCVSLLGSLGLGTGLAYLVGVGMMVLSASQAWTLFFITYGPWLVVVPAGALLAHLYLRTHLGRWYLDRGRLEEAREYTSDRLEHSLLRSRKETLFHRLYCGRAEIAGQDYVEALEMLTRGFAMPESDDLEARFRRWQMEAALRLEDGEMLEEAWRAAGRLEAGGEQRAALRACMAEWAALEGERDGHREHLEEADWLEAAGSRADFAAAIGVMRFGDGDDAREQGLELLESARDVMVREVPGCSAEIRARQAECLAGLGRIEESRGMLDRGEEEPSDRRSRRVVERVRGREEFQQKDERDEVA